VRNFITAAVAAALLTGGLALAQEAAKPAAPGAKPAAQAAAPAPRPKPAGYLPADQPFDGAAFLPPYPAKGSPAEAADIAAWREALKGEGTPRWKQATADDPVGLQDGLTQFQCALGATLNQQNAPTLMSILGKAQFDAHWAIEKSKAHFKRARPFADDPKAPLCLAIPPEARAKASTAYPGGHSTLGMTWGLILAELAPDRSTRIMDRVRDYSHSRLVCGLHFPSDLEAGHMLGAGLVARLHAEPAFRADMDKARAEVSAARRTAAPPAGCALT
jgi:acid phosphatase (class A)